MGTWRSPDTGPGQGSSNAVCPGTLPTKPSHTPQARSLCLWDVSLTFSASSSILSPGPTIARLCLVWSSCPQPLYLLLRCPPPLIAPCLSCPALPCTPEHPPTCLHGPLCFVLPNHRPPCGLCPLHPKAALLQAQTCAAELSGWLVCPEGEAWMLC